MFIPFKKVTLLIPSSPDNLRDVKHLFIILTNPPSSEKQAKVLLVNVSTVYNNHVFDDACIIEAGEHPFIKRRSFIDYRYARIEEASMLIKKVKSGEFIAHESMSEGLYTKIVNGLFKSKFIATKFQEFYNQYKS